MAPVPTPGTRLLRSGRTGLRRSERTIHSKTTTRRKIAKSKKQSFQQYDEALDNLKRKKKTGNDNRSIDDVGAGTHRCQYQIWKATSDSTVVGFDRQTTKSKEKSVEPYDEALDDQNRSETKDSNQPTSLDDVGAGTHRHQCPIRLMISQKLVCLSHRMMMMTL